MELNVSVVTFLSAILTGCVISNAFYLKKQFYPSVVYITKSNASMAVMYIQALVMVVLAAKVVRSILFGRLRAAETEHLMEKAWHAVIETCLAFTVFRDDFSPKFVAMFTLLLLMKCFHWLAEDRVDYMERSPVITFMFHVRMMCILAVISSTDSFFISHAYFTTMLRGASVQLVFGFEYAILLTAVFIISIKYVLHTLDLRSVHPWENKAVYLLYSELALNFVKVVLYALFLFMMIKLHTFPLFTIRPVYLTIRAFKKTLRDVVMSRRAINNMNSVYSDATQEELSSGDNVCIICREEMTVGAKKLPCNHIFHTACLRSWFQRQQTCPTCRLDILSMPTPGAVAAAAQARVQQQQNANQAQAQPPQPPQAAGPVPIMGGMPFGFMPPQQAHPHQAANQQPFTGASPTTPPSTGSAQQPTSSTPAAGSPPNFVEFSQNLAALQQRLFQNQTSPGNNSFVPMSPPPFLPPPFLLPFPSPPTFSGLSDEEVSSMESTERAGVEARIRCLRNVQTLLDAATVQLQQYLSILTTLSLSPDFTTSPSTQAPLSQKEVPSTSQGSTGDGAADTKDKDSPSTSFSNTDEKINDAEAKSLNEEDEIRKRRLLHFTSNNSTD